MNSTLIIQDDENNELVKVRLGELDPISAALAVMEALQGLGPKRKLRSDAGQPRKPEGAR